MSKINKEISEAYDRIKIRVYLKEELGLSTRFIKKAAMEKRVLIDGNSVKMNYILNKGEQLEVDLAREESQNINPENIPIDIVYEDEDIIVINKKPFMIVHPTKNCQSGTLANGILYYFKETNQNCIVRLVSRLDMNTSGLIIIGKNQYAHMQLSQEMKSDKFQKRYLALVHGNLEEKEGTINKAIYRNPTVDSIKRVIDPRGQESITHYKVVESFKGADLVECLLETGRTHQIRVHLESLGHPIWGDDLYGEEFNDEEYIGRQALHAYGLDFFSPRTRKPLSLRSDLPYDFLELIEKLK